MDTPVVPETQVPSPDLDKLTQALKREKMVRAQQLELQKQKMELEGRIPQEIEKVNQTWKERLASDPLTVMRESGLSFEQLSNLVMTHNPQDQKFYEQETKIKALESRLEQILEGRKKDESDNINIVRSQMQREVTQLVKSKAEEYEALNATGDEGYKAVVKYIIDTTAEEGVQPSLEEACQIVEDHLIEQSLSFARLKKVQAKLTPAQEAVIAQAVKPGSPAPTLTRANTQVSAHKISDRERRERAILAAQGKL